MNTVDRPAAEPLHSRATPECAVPECAATFQCISKSEQQIRHLVSQVVHHVQPSWRGTERREYVRAPFPHVIQVIPIARKTLTAVDSPILGIGRHIAPRGLDFYHTEPLPSRRVVVAFDGPQDSLKYLVVDVSWSRFLKQGCYLSGGRFTEVVDLSAPQDAQTEDPNW